MDQLKVAALTNALRDAQNQAQAAGDELLAALQHSEIVRSETARETFDSLAGRALAAYENWRKVIEDLSARLQIEFKRLD